MVERLKIPLIPAEVLNTSHFDTIAIVDSQPGTGNNSLPHRPRRGHRHRPPPRARGKRA